MSEYRIREDGVKIWWPDIRVGDVLKAPSGALRCVRYVSLGYRNYVGLAIRHCSWTHRCYTLYTTNELHGIGYTLAGARFALRTKMDRRIARNITTRERDLKCCDVVGLP